MENSIIDLIIRIKNGYLSRKETIVSPFSNFKKLLLIKLKDLGYIKDFQVEGEKIKKLNIELLYKDGQPVLSDIKIVSTPGARKYASYRDLKPVLNNFGFMILSTPKGILTNKEARRVKLGGELLFEIW